MKLPLLLLPFLAAALGAQSLSAPAPLTRLQVARQDDRAACLDLGQIARAGIQPLAPQLRQIASLSDVHQLAGVIASLQRLGGPALFQLSADSRGLVLAPGGYSLARAAYQVPPGAPTTAVAGPAGSLLAAYQRHIETMFVLLGDQRRDARTGSKQAVAIETSLAQAPPDGLPRTVTMAQLAALVPNFDWRTFFSVLDLPRLRTVSLASPAFLQNLNGLLLTVPLPAWKNYLRWQWLHATAALLPPAFDDADYVFFHAGELPPARARRCAAAVNAISPAAAAAVILRRNDYFGNTLRLRGYALARQLARAAH